MAGKRMIHSNICESKKLSTVSYAAEALYYRLLSKSDDDGNFNADARIVLGQCLALRKDQTPETVEELLLELATVTNGDKQPLISFYIVDGDRYLHINRFQDFQYLRPDRTATAACPTHPEEIESSILKQRKESGLPVVNQRYTNGIPPAENGLPLSEMVGSNQINVKSNQIKSNECNFKNMAVRYRRAFHVNLSHGTIQKDEYSKACIQFTEDVVLANFDEWSPENMWIKERRHTNGLRQFYDALPAMIEADIAVKKDEEEKQRVVNALANVELDSIILAQKGHAAEELARAAKRREAEEITQRVAANPDALFGG